MEQNPRTPRRAAPPAGESLEKEIAIIREMIDRVNRQTCNVDDTRVLLRALDIISSASARLVGLLREQRETGERAQSGKSLINQMDQVLEDAARKQGLIS